MRMCARSLYKGGSNLKLIFQKRFLEHCRRLKAPAAKLRKAWIRLLAGLTCVLMTSTVAFASPTAPGQGSDIWSWLDYVLGDLYNKFLSISTIAACVAASVCLILINFSTDDRAVATSRAWLKRILLSWVILNVLGYIMTYLVNLTQGGAYVP